MPRNRQSFTTRLRIQAEDRASSVLDRVRGKSRETFDDVGDASERASSRVSGLRERLSGLLVPLAAVTAAAATVRAGFRLAVDSLRELGQEEIGITRLSVLLENLGSSDVEGSVNALVRLSETRTSIFADRDEIEAIGRIVQLTGIVDIQRLGEILQIVDGIAVGMGRSLPDAVNVLRGEGADELFALIGGELRTAADGADFLEYNIRKLEEAAIGKLGSAAAGGAAGAVAALDNSTQNLQEAFGELLVEVGVDDYFNRIALGAERAADAIGDGERSLISRLGTLIVELNAVLTGQEVDASFPTTIRPGDPGTLQAVERDGAQRTDASLGERTPIRAPRAPASVREAQQAAEQAEREAERAAEAARREAARERDALVRDAARIAEEQRRAGDQYYADISAAVDEYGQSLAEAQQQLRVFGDETAAVAIELQALEQLLSLELVLAPEQFAAALEQVGLTAGELEARIIALREESQNLGIDWNQVTEMLAAGSINEFGSVVEDTFSAIVDSSQDASVAFEQGTLNALSSVASGFARYFAAQALGALASGNFTSAGLYTAASLGLSALSGTIGGAASNAGAGARTTGRSTTNAFAGTADRGSAEIIIEGGLLDTTDPRQAQALGDAISDLSGRRVILTSR